MPEFRTEIVLRVVMFCAENRTFLFSTKRHNNSLNDKHALGFFMVHASLASVNVGKTRSGDVPIGFKLEDSTRAMWVVVTKYPHSFALKASCGAV